ncbi:hypothetical protein [Virgibacillus ihumii]|uniref:hypothetical protein n=1 Tax=Virgibacillus ihumii TaxID=2686091 RepID=UPI00157CB4E5|nr:hypothetical protein [Virgibacillus ihumii]
MRSGEDSALALGKEDTAKVVYLSRSCTYAGSENEYIPTDRLVSCTKQIDFSMSQHLYGSNNEKAFY